MYFNPVPSRPAIAGVEVPGVNQAAARAVMVAVPVSALVWPVRAGSAGTAGRRCWSRDPQDQIDLPRQHRVDLGEFFGGRRFAAIGIQFEVGPVPVKSSCSCPLTLGRFSRSRL